MKKLTVRNNWEVLMWEFNGDHLNPYTVDSIVCGDVVFEATAKSSEVSYYDHGHTYSTTQVDLVIDATIGDGIPVKISLYKNPSVLNVVTDVILKDYME